MLHPVALLVEVAEELFSLDPGAIGSLRRTGGITLKRWAVCLVAQRAGYSQNAIARHMGKDRTSVRYALDHGHWGSNAETLHEEWQWALERKH